MLLSAAIAAIDGGNGGVAAAAPKIGIESVNSAIAPFARASGVGYP